MIENSSISCRGSGLLVYMCCLFTLGLYFLVTKNMDYINDITMQKTSRDAIRSKIRVNMATILSHLAWLLGQKGKKISMAKNA